jgi:hypothetical protein
VLGRSVGVSDGARLGVNVGRLVVGRQVGDGDRIVGLNVGDIVGFRVGCSVGV